MQYRGLQVHHRSDLRGSGAIEGAPRNPTVKVAPTRLRGGQEGGGRRQPIRRSSPGIVVTRYERHHRTHRDHQPIPLQSNAVAAAAAAGIRIPIADPPPYPSEAPRHGASKAPKTSREHATRRSIGGGRDMQSQLHRAGGH